MASRSLTWCARDAFLLPLCYTACFSEKAFQREMRRLRVPANAQPPFVMASANASTHFFEKSDGSVAAIVCMDTGTDAEPIQVACLLVHEAVHIWQEAMRLIGEDKPSAEFEAYTIQTISQELMYLYAEGKNR